MSKAQHPTGWRTVNCKLGKKFGPLFLKIGEMMTKRNNLDEQRNYQTGINLSKCSMDPTIPKLNMTQSPLGPKPSWFKIRTHQSTDDCFWEHFIIFFSKKILIYQEIFFWDHKNNIFKQWKVRTIFETE